MPSQLRREVEIEFEEIKIRYNKMNKVLKTSPVGTLSPNGCTFERYKWAYWVVRSRWVSCYDYQLETVRPPWLISSTHDYGSLCPWFDMCNHR